MLPEDSPDRLARCTAEFRASSAPSRSFDTLHECLLFLVDKASDEPLSNIHVHAASGEYTINGPELEALIVATRVAGTA
ncbi:hypothetical protein ASE61_25195 [Bosea sp. Root670]|nr:hypothetical protein ASE61_25195 [Bosea sp. Root670]